MSLSLLLPVVQLVALEFRELEDGVALHQSAAALEGQSIASSCVTTMSCKRWSSLDLQKAGGPEEGVQVLLLDRAPPSSQNQISTRATRSLAKTKSARDPRIHL